MNKTFKFLLENEKTRDISCFRPVVIAPGRFNPPHRGHKLVIDKLIALSEKLNAEPVVLIIDSGKYSSKNPLSGEIRKEYLQKMFPEMRFEIYENAFEAVIQLAEKHQQIPVGGVAGQDRGKSYKAMIGQIFGKGIENTYLAEVLYRDLDSDEDVVGVSGTKARQAAMEGNVAAFRAMTGLNDDEARSLMKLLIDGTNSV